MSILGSMFTAWSGLRAHGEAMDVVSDNIANMNTIAFKGARAHFSDVLGSSLSASGSAESAGQGVRLGAVESIFEQGALLGTGVPTDLAIMGEGFFAVNGKFAGVEGRFFTRDGSFSVDEKGRLVNLDGLVVQGFPVDTAGNMSNTVGDLVLSANLQVEPQKTGNVSLSANLDASEEVPVDSFDPRRAAATSNFSNSILIYDSLGGAHSVDIYFRRASPDTWEWHVLAAGKEVTGGTDGVPVDSASGELTFTNTGALNTERTNASSFNFIGAQQGQVINFDLGDSITTDRGSGRQGVTSYDGPSNITKMDQDGLASGQLASMGISADGTMTGVFSNGSRRVLGKVAVATFRNQSGLLRSGSGLYTPTSKAGLAVYGEAGSGGRGNIVSGTLEQSNIDLAKEFITTIAYQRGFQANSRAVSTGDEMLKELVNLKR